MGFLTGAERQAWLAGVDRDCPFLLAFVRAIDDLCEAALEQTGRVLPARHAAAILLQTVEIEGRFMGRQAPRKGIRDTWGP